MKRWALFSLSLTKVVLWSNHKLSTAASLTISLFNVKTYSSYIVGFNDIFTLLFCFIELLDRKNSTVAGKLDITKCHLTRSFARWRGTLSRCKGYSLKIVFRVTGPWYLRNGSIRECQGFLKKVKHYFEVYTYQTFRISL